jgi:hypothetical protein
MDDRWLLDDSDDDDDGAHRKPPWYRHLPAAGRFVRPDFFEENVRALARARPGLAAGGVRKGRNARSG